VHATRIAIAVGVLLSTTLITSAGDLHGVASRAMAGRSGSVVVVSVKTGAVLASHNLDGAGRRVARPGSAVKPFTLMAFLVTGVVKPEEALACRRKIEIGGHKLDCGHPNSGPLNAISALAYSCNDYFTTMAARLRPKDLQDEFLRDGLANRSSLVRQSAAGEVDLSNTRGELQLQAIGEQNIRTTPLGLLSAYRELALRRVNGDADAAQKVVLLGLDAAVEYGMARMAQPAGGIRVTGKTGTAMADEGLWTHGWFAGFAPADDPEIVLVVFLEHGTGPADAAPVARQIFATYQYGSSR